METNKKINGSDTCIDQLRYPKGNCAYILEREVAHGVVVAIDIHNNSMSGNCH